MTKTLRQPGREPVLWMVADNEDHAFLTTETFTANGRAVQLNHLQTG